MKVTCIPQENGGGSCVHTQKVKNNTFFCAHQKEKSITDIA